MTRRICSSRKSRRTDRASWGYLSCAYSSESKYNLSSIVAEAMVCVGYLFLFCSCQRPTSQVGMSGGYPRKPAKLPRQGVGVTGANHAHVVWYSCRVSRHRVIRDLGRRLPSCLEPRQEQPRSRLRAQIPQTPMGEVGRECGGTLIA
jgi:hypothetical protein